MKRHLKFWVVTVLAGLLLAAITTGVVLLTCQVPLGKCSEAYRHYHKVSGIQAAFFKDKQINDTVAVDMTLLTATDSAGWARLMNDFHIPVPPPEVLALMMQSDASVTILPFDRENPGQQGDDKESLLVTYSYQLRLVALFSIDDPAQVDAIIYHHVEQL